jgi:hypothetical protein
VIFGRGNPCPDEVVASFIIDGTPPDESVCEGDVVGYYIPLLPLSLDEFDSAESMLDAIEFEISYMPEYYWWDFVNDTPVGCNQGGTITFTATDAGDGFVFEECAFMDGLVLSGDGSTSASGARTAPTCTSGQVWMRPSTTTARETSSPAEPTKRHSSLSMPSSTKIRCRSLA